MELAFHGLADTSFGTVNGKPMSLAQVGYNDAGLDDVWCVRTVGSLCGSSSSRSMPSRCSCRRSRCLPPQQKQPQ